MFAVSPHLDSLYLKIANRSPSSRFTQRTHESYWSGWSSSSRIKCHKWMVPLLLPPLVFVVPKPIESIFWKERQIEWPSLKIMHPPDNCFWNCVTRNFCRFPLSQRMRVVRFLPAADDIRIVMDWQRSGPPCRSRCYTPTKTLSHCCGRRTTVHSWPPPFRLRRAQL